MPTFERGAATNRFRAMAFDEVAERAFETASIPQAAIIGSRRTSPTSATARPICCLRRPPTFSDPAQSQFMVSDTRQTFPGSSSQAIFLSGLRKSRSSTHHSYASTLPDIFRSCPVCTRFNASISGRASMLDRTKIGSTSVFQQSTSSGSGW
jgi:hypothetical protein